MNCVYIYLFISQSLWVIIPANNTVAQDGNLTFYTGLQLWLKLSCANIISMGINE